MAFPSTSLIKSEIDSALFFHKKYKKFGTKMIDIMSKIMPEIPPSFFSAMVLSERASLYDLSDIFRTLVYVCIKKGHTSGWNARGLFVWVQTKSQYIMRLFQT